MDPCRKKGGTHPVPKRRYLALGVDPRLGVRNLVELEQDTADFFVKVAVRELIGLGNVVTLASVRHLLRVRKERIEKEDIEVRHW